MDWNNHKNLILLLLVIFFLKNKNSKKIYIFTGFININWKFMVIFFIKFEILI